jgi:two-component system, cell cycle sensor histidine kinase PleC
VPVLICTFIAVILIGALVQIFENRQRAIADVNADVSTIAKVVADDLRHSEANNDQNIRDRAQDLLGRLATIGFIRNSQTVLVTDEQGVILAAEPVSTTPISALCFLIVTALHVLIWARSALSTFTITSEPSSNVERAKSNRSPNRPIAEQSG